VAFLAKVAFASLGINDADYLAKHVPDGSILTQPNGTGPYLLKEWVKGDHITFAANPNYWGDPAKAATAILRWSTEAAQRLTELQAGTVDGIDNPAPDDFPKVTADPTLKVYPRTALNVMYIGMNNTSKPFDNEKVRQAIAMGIDRQRIVDNFYPPGSTVADYFTPCAIPLTCGGAKYPSFDPVKAKDLLTQAGFPNGFKTKISFRDKDRGYISNQPAVAQDIQAQLKANLGIDAAIDVQESGTFIDNSNAGKLPGLFILGWGADFPDQTNFMDYHFGLGTGKKFGTPYQDLVDVITKAGQSADNATRQTLYNQANDLLAQHIPVVAVSHGGSAAVFKADVEGAHSSPLTSEQLFVMKPGTRNQLVFMQNAEPLGVYCADETDGESLRACEQVTQSLYGYKTGGTETEPVLATACTSNADSTVWTCKLRENVKFGDGSTFDANDVVVSYAAQWDTKNPLHKGRTGGFDYWPGLFGGFLNPPPA
jgi:ABC-type transport system substrate-binding protein